MRLTIISFLLSLVFALEGNAQDLQIITGIVYNENGSVLYGAKVSQDEDVRINFSDLDGAFHLMLRPELDNVLKVWKKGHETVYVTRIDSLTEPLHITLELDTTASDSVTVINVEGPDETYEEPEPDLEYLDHLVESKFGVSVDVLNVDFDAFEEEIEPFNSNFISSFNRKTVFEYGWTFPSKINFALQYGWGRKREIARDTVQLDLRRQQYGFTFGYNLVNEQKLRVAPKVGARMYHFLLLNYNDDNKIPLTQYLTERDLQLTVNQPIVFAGIDVLYLLRNKYAPKNTSFFSFGGYAGYAQRITSSPWLRGVGNRLDTDRELAIEDFNFGFAISYHFFGEE